MVDDAPEVAGEAVGVADVADHALRQVPSRVDLPSAVEASEVGRPAGDSLHDDIHQPREKVPHFVRATVDEREGIRGVGQPADQPRVQHVGGVGVEPRLARPVREQGAETSEEPLVAITPSKTGSLLVHVDRQ